MIHTVPSGEIPPRDFSNVFGHSSYATFTIPISDSQAEAARTEIERINETIPNYNVISGEVCSALANQIMRAAGLGRHLFVNPSKDFQSLSEIARTLAMDPTAQFTRDGLFIPEAFRGLQRDYAYVGGGYDTPSERIRRARSGRQASALSDQREDRIAPDGRELMSPDRHLTFNGRFGNWRSLGDRIAADDLNEGAPQPGGMPRVASSVPERYLNRRIASKPGSSIFDTGASAVPSLPPNEALSLDRPASLNDRFGNWSDLPTGGISPRNPNLPMPPPQASRPLGIFSGQPMPDWITPPPIFGYQDRPRAPVDEGREWLMRMIRSVGD